MTGAEKARLALLIALIPVLMLSIVGNQQFANAYPLWAQKHMDFVLFGWDVPVTWLQAVDAAVSTATMLGSIAFWRWWATRRREPDELVKMGLGALLAAGGPALIVIASTLAETTGEKVSLGWTLGYTLVNDLGFANILPVGLALYSRAAPRRLEGLVIGVYYLHLFIGNTFVGWLAGFLETMPGRQFWALHAGLVALRGRPAAGLQAGVRQAARAGGRGGAVNEEAWTFWSPVRVLVGILVLGVLIAAGWWFFQDPEIWPRGEALGQALRPIAEGKEPDQALVARVIWDNYRETRANASRWSGALLGADLCRGGAQRAGCAGAQARDLRQERGDEEGPGRPALRGRRPDDHDLHQRRLPAQVAGQPNRRGRARAHRLRVPGEGMAPTRAPTSLPSDRSCSGGTWRSSAAPSNARHPRKRPRPPSAGK